MQIYADVTRHAAAPDRLRAGARRSARRCTRRSPPACTPTSTPRRRRWAASRRDAYVPDERRADAYDALYAHYTRLHDHFGRGGDDVMHALRRPRPREVALADVDALRREVCALHAELPRNGLVAWTSGNLSARVPGEELMVIKASGVAYDELTPERDRRLRPRRRARRGRARALQRRRHARLRLPAHAARSAASRTPTAPYATAWAARGEPIPCVLTAMADEFGGEIPIGPFALIGDEEIGRGDRRDARRPPLAGGADAQPRRVHARRAARATRSRPR